MIVWTALTNTFPPIGPRWDHLSKISIPILEGIIKKISYERRDYESENLFLFVFLRDFIFKKTLLFLILKFFK